MRLQNPVVIQALDQSKFPKTWGVAEHALNLGALPGAVLGFWQKRDPDRIHLQAFGNRRLIPSLLSMEADTVFDLASLTKIIATAPLAAALVDRGWLSWDTPVQAVLPEFSSSRVLLSHLLSHTAGFVAWKPYWEEMRADFSPQRLETIAPSLRHAWMRERVLKESPEEAPGTRCLYSDLSFLILGFLLEELTGRSLDEAVQKWIWEPMGLSSLKFNPVNQQSVRTIDLKVAATEECSWRGGVLQGVVHDDNCWAMGGIAGHAGAFGKAEDVLRFARALMSGFFSNAVTEAMWTRVAYPQGCDRTLGWDTPSGETPSSGKYFSSSTVGHLGFTGTSLWLDRSAEVACVVLTNRVHPTRENLMIREFRPLIHNALREDLMGKLI